MPRHRHDLQCISSRTEGGCFLSLESVSTYSNTIQKISVGRLSIPPFLFKSSAHPVPTTTKIDANIKVMLTDDIELKIFGRNITDEIVGNSSLALPLVPGSHFKLWEPGKEVGLAIRKKF